MIKIQNGLKEKIPVGFASHTVLPQNAYKTIHNIPNNADNCNPSNWLHRYINRDQIIPLQLGIYTL